MLYTRLKQVMLGLLLLSPMLAHPGSGGELAFLGKQYKEIASLPDGHWLVLTKHAVRLLDAQGKVLHSLDVRAEHLDTRVIQGKGGSEIQAVLFDADQQQTWVLQLDLHAAQPQIRISRKLAPVNYALQSQCLYRDAQQLSHVFMIAKDGQAEQWLLSGKAPLKLRNLALPPEVEFCRVDDRQQALYVSEAGFGVWRYTANGEGVPERTLVAGRQPRGEITGEVGALAVLPQGLAVVDGDDGRIHLLDAQGHATQHNLRVANAQALAVAGNQLLVLNDAGWQAHALASLGQAQAAQNAALAPALPVLMPRGQTESVARAGDAADDPAIWVHPTQPARSRVIATNKKQGLLSYDLQGKQVQLIAAGRLNNVDLRQNIRWSGHKPSDLALATQRDEAALAVFTLDSAGQLRDVARIKTGLNDIYGTCLYQPSAGGLEVFANDKDGRFEHYRIERSGQAYVGKLLRSFRTAGQPEGCVADDAEQRLFYGEEKQGIWSMSASAAQPSEPQLIMAVGEHLVADVEGMGLYHGKHASYLIASSQGNSSFVVLDAKAPFAFRGAFRIGINAEAGIDGVSDTDGLEVSPVNFGPAYRQGMLVVQDGYKRLPDGAQNFKMVSWEDIAAALKLE